LLVDLGIVEQDVDAFRATAREHATALRPVGLPRQPENRAGVIAGGRFEPERAVGGGECDRDESRADQLAQPLRHECEEARQVYLGGERVPNLYQGLELT
jgi:hypothetical protein